MFYNQSINIKFQLSISCRSTFKVMKVFVVYLVISTKCFITMKVQEIESWNFACPNILKRCAWRPNFSHFSWEMTKILTVPAQHMCPTFSIGDGTYLNDISSFGSGISLPFLKRNGCNLWWNTYCKHFILFGSQKRKNSNSKV